MSLGWDDVSELQPPAGLFFILQVIYEHGDQRWNGIDGGKPPCLTQIPHGLSQARTRVTAVTGRLLTAFSLIFLSFLFLYFSVFYVFLHSWKNARIDSSPSNFTTSSTTKLKQTNTNVHVLSGIQTHDLSIKAAKTHAPDRMVTLTRSWAMVRPSHALASYWKLWQ
jgi:hypothetical protein